MGTGVEVLAALPLLAVWCWYASMRPVTAVLIVVGMVVFAEELLALLLHAGAPAGFVRILVGSRDAFAWLLAATLAVRAARSYVSSTVLLIGGGYLTVMLVFFLLDHSPASRLTQIEALRDALVPILGVLVGALLTPEERWEVARKSVVIVAIGAAASLAQLPLPTSFIKSTLGVGKYWAVVKQVPGFLNPLTGLPGNYFTSSGSPRLTGTFGDPLSAGEVIAASLVLAVAYRNALRRPKAIIICLSVALVFTFTRDGWILALVGIVAVWAVTQRASIVVLRFYVGLGAIALAYLVVPPVHAYFVSIGSSGSTIGHSQAFSESLHVHFTLFGSGWGTGGALAAQSYSQAVSTESLFVTLFQQIGWIGGICAIGALGYAIVASVRGGLMTPVVVAVVMGEIISGLVSENLISFNAGFIPFLVLPLLAGRPPAFARRTVASGGLTGPAHKGATPGPVRPGFQVAPGASERVGAVAIPAHGGRSIRP